MDKDKFIAFDAYQNEYETFPDFEKAKAWLDETNCDGITEELTEGSNFIAKITHRSKYTITDRKENYHVHNPSCTESTSSNLGISTGNEKFTCDKETWPYNEDWEHAGDVTYEPVEDQKLPGMGQLINDEIIFSTVELINGGKLQITCFNKTQNTYFKVFCDPYLFFGMFGDALKRSNTEWEKRLDHDLH